MKLTMKNGKEFIEKGLVKYQNELYGYALSLTHNASDAKDLLQDMALHILSKADKYEEKGLFYAWAKRTMKNRFLNNERDSKRWLTTGYDDIPADEFPYCVAETYGSVDYELITKAIATLPATQASRFMRVTEGYSYNEIAKEANVSLSDVKNNLYAARVKLRRWIRE